MAYYLTSFHPFLAAIIICLVFLPLHFSPNQGNTNEGFSINLIRKTSLKVLPQRLRGLSAISRTPQSPISAYLGEYLMEISIGTPPVKVYGIADTGSDLTWTQCVPCKNCYKQLNPMFDPQKSSSYSNIPCNSNLCHELNTGVCSPQKQCNYTYGYADDSMTQGALSQETVTLTSTTGESVPLKGIVFGCGHKDSEGFNDHEMGIIGLGGGPVSLISQIGSSFGGKMFSQCLVPFHTDVSVSSRMSFGKASVCSSQKQCNYTYAYGDSSMTQGALAQETVTLTSTTGESVPLKGIVFGCGHKDSEGFNDHEMGIIGLGGGPVSLISQIGSSFGGKMFSQCLVPFHTDVSVSSRMSFGKASKVSGNGVVSTPLVTKEDKTPYFVTLLGFSVGNTYLHYNGSSKTVEKGNMFLDSGTPPTILPTQFYDRVVAQVKNQVAMKPIVDDPDLGSQLCYQTKNNLNGPMLIAHFEGADVTLAPIQTFISPKDGVFCLGFTNTSSDVGIYGNFVQSNYLIGFDLEAKMVSFKPTDCTKNK
ncbi:hypothetical protein ACSQ67_002838 [Phaseolus vulgaris]